MKGNFIQALKEQKENWILVREQTIGNLIWLEKYLNSDKFRCGNELDGYVNIRDLLPKLAEIRSNLNEQ